MADIIINNFQNGWSQSPYLTGGAVAKAVNLDIFDYPGVARINYEPVLESATTGDHTVTAYPVFFAKDPGNAGHYYCLDSAAQLYKSDDSGDTWTKLTHTPTSAAGLGLAIWKDHLFIIEDTSIDIYGPLSSNPAFTWDNWESGNALTSSAWHPAFVSRNDGYLYIGNAGQVAQLQEVAGQTFVPGTGATYTWTKDKITLPKDKVTGASGYIVRALEEQREDLLIGSYHGNAADLDVSSYIFVWDRSSTTFDFPIFVPEVGIRAMLNVGNRVYVLAGDHGRMYQYSEAGLIYLSQLPHDYDNVTSGIYGGAMAYWRGKFYIGAIRTPSTTFTPAGIYSFNPRTNKWTLEFLISTGEDGSGTHTYVEPRAVFAPSSTTLLIGWRSDAGVTPAYGIDRVRDSFNRYDGYAAYLESFLYLVGANKKQEYVSSLYSNHCYISGNEPKQMKHKVIFKVYEDCLLYLDKGLEARKDYGE